MLSRYLPQQQDGGDARTDGGGMRADDTMSTERELLYKVLFDMRGDINDLKRMMSRSCCAAARQASCGPVHDVEALPADHGPEHVASAYAPAAVYAADAEDVTDEPHARDDEGRRAARADHPRAAPQ